MTRFSSSSRDARGLGRSLTLAALVVATMGMGLVPGCGDPQPAVNRVQPMALEKAIFAGEWYMQQTVIDTPYSVGFTFVGEQGGLERIRWEIQEDYLVARRSYQHIAGSEPQGIGGAGDQTGAAIAMYRISSHFDIRRQYNPTTGEELNVIEENSSDRPWYERRFMRVDWSTNLIAETDLFALHRVIDGVSAEPVAYYVQDPHDPNAPQFVHDEQGNVHYIDIVNQLFVRPESVTFSDGFSIPVCYLYYHDHLDCTASQITVRNSFLRVEPEADTQYQPLVYTGDRMERFGFFNTIRAGYDNNYGVVESVRYHFVNRHNLWQASHRTNTDGSLVRCVRDADCSSVGGSTCDLDWARSQRALDDMGHLSGACTIPYTQRQTQPVVYYLSDNMPADLLPDAQAFGEDWNSALVDVVGSLREIECNAQPGADAATCAMQRTRADAQHMFILCPSPVPAGADPACGPEGTEARPGDLRYSLVGWVNEPFLASPLGYGPSSADPLTGQIIMGNAFIYGAGVETLESFARDIIRLFNGDVDFTAVENGDVVQAWVNRMNATALEGAPPTDASHAVPIDPAHMENITAGMDFSWARDVRPDSARSRPSSFQEFVQQRREAQDRLFGAGAFGNADRTDARVSRLFGTDIERMMTTSEMRMAAGLDPNATLDDVTLAQASPLRGLSMSHLTEMRQLRDQIQQHGCVLDATFAEDGLTGLAREIQQRASTGDGTIEWYGHSYPLRGADGHLDYELVRQMLRHPIFEAVTAHEVGHTLGLRHNFSGSFDALNYQPTYWMLRDDGNMAPRLWDPESATETAGRIREFQYSTVMDYGENFVSTDAQRIGHYDRAALKMGYGDLVEVFTDAAQPNDVAFWSAIQDFGWPAPPTVAAFSGGAVSTYEYTDWPQLLGGIEHIQHRADVPYTSLRPQSFLAMNGINGNYADAQGRVTVPYRFCSDEQADLDPDCLRYDAGADAYESLQSIADTYWNYYIFTNFRRQRVGFTPEGVIERVHDRWFEKLQNGNDIYVLDRALYEDVFGGTLPADFFTGQHGMGAWTAAAATSYGLLTRVVGAPTPDTYARRTTPDGLEAYMTGGTGTGAHAINAFDGRYIDTTWNFDAGYYWFDQINRVGYFYDKVIALAVLTDPTTHFIGRDTDADIRRYQINFASTFGPAMTSFFRGAMASDWRATAPRFDASFTNLNYPDPAAQAAGTMAGTPIDPDMGFSIELYASVLGMTFIPQTYNQDFLNRSRVFVRGGAEEIAIDPSHTVVEFTDPVSGLTYAAVSYPDAGGAETGVGAQMILRAQNLQTRGQTAELRRFIDNIDIVRRLTWLLGAGAQP
jgi:hypothetical protein